MRSLLTTQSQNCYREQIQKEMLTRLTWKSRYMQVYPSCCNTQNHSREPNKLPQLPADPRAALPPVTRTPEEQSSHFPPPLTPPLLSVEGEGQMNVAPLMRPVSPQTRKSLYQDSSHHGKGRSLYLQRRGQIRPEDKFDFPLLSSWEYGWRLGDYTLDYRTPVRARSSVVKNTFYARNGVFSSSSATDTLG
ncbi:protein ATP6V1FNB [Mastacembelus armatus]|uniref:protein ATP6V1FNB n=1 Tax=Mastacembelus armatus TaxID=205130 RepID=UPI001436C1BB|nr:protein ATP6V1FNB [Mastacembelus armatus]